MELQVRKIPKQGKKYSKIILIARNNLNSIENIIFKGVKNNKITSQRL